MSSNDDGSAQKRPELNRVAKKSTDSNRSSSSTSTTTYTTRRQAALKAQKTIKPDTKFMDNFDPDNSNRERRKITRKLAARRIPGAVYDESGVHIATDLDLCDCLNENCPGCFFPCKKCYSQKCGSDCRSNRKFIYDQIEYHGYEFVVKNPLLEKR